MTEIYSLPVSTSLLAEVNAVGVPNRLKAQDGTIGDTEHQQKVSDHNRDEIGNTGSSSDSDKTPEVHARDVDSRGPWLPGWSAERIVQILVANVRAMGYAGRRVKYVIYRGRIWEWRFTDGRWQFTQKAYLGADPHNEHFHVSFMYGSGTTGNPENNTAPWGILAALKGENVDVNDVKTLLTTDGLINNPSNASDRGKNPTLKMNEALTNIYFHTLATEQAVASIGPVLAQLASKDTVDEQALAQALAPLLAALLPTGTEVTPDAIVEAFRKMANGEGK